MTRSAHITAFMATVGQNDLGMPLPSVQLLTDLRLCAAAEAAAALVAEEGAAPGRERPAPAHPRCCSTETSAVVLRSAVSGSSFLPVEAPLTAAVDAAAPAGSPASSPARWPLRISAKAAGVAVDFALGRRPVVLPCRSCSAAGPFHGSAGSLALGEPGPGGPSAFAPVAPGRPRASRRGRQPSPLQHGSASVALPALLLPQF